MLQNIIVVSIIYAVVHHTHSNLNTQPILFLYLFSLHFRPRLLAGFASMKVGEKAKLLIRSDYGCGEKAMGANIPANSNLIFDVELLGFQEKEKQKWEVGCLLL